MRSKKSFSAPLMYEFLDGAWPRGRAAIERGAPVLGPSLARDRNARPHSKPRHPSDTGSEVTSK